MSSLEITLHWVYVTIMFGSALFFQFMARDHQLVPGYKYLIHTFIVVWSGLAYAAIAFGKGQTLYDGTIVYYARYIDWVVSTPLLLLSLNLTGKYSISMQGTVTAALLGSQVIMIITGLVAELSTGTAQWFFYAAGCVALAVVLYIIWSPLYQKASSQGDAIRYVYRKSALFLTIQWLAYPLIWMLGAPGLGMLDKEGTTVFFIILPIISKAGFGFYNLSLLRSLPLDIRQKVYEDHSQKATPQ